jgi:hypothetical protein
MAYNDSTKREAGGTVAADGYEKKTSCDFKATHSNQIDTEHTCIITHVFL